MAHFAQLDKQLNVIDVIVVANESLDNLSFPQSEPVGVAFCQALFPQPTNWAQTSYNASFRYNYAGIGSTFDPAAQPDGAFIAPQPYPSWILNTTTYQWEAPVPYPDDGKVYYWDEATLSWVLVEPQPE